MNIGIHAPDRPDSHRRRVALPFCHLTLRSPKPPQWPYPKECNTLGDRIRARRLDLGLTQKALAALLCVNPWTVGNWEGNATHPAERFIARLCRVLGDAAPDLAETRPCGSSSPGERLREFRIARGLPQAAVARMLGVDRGTVRAWETGTTRPQKRLRPQLMEFLGRVTPGADRDET